MYVCSYVFIVSDVMYFFRYVFISFVLLVGSSFVLYFFRSSCLSFVISLFSDFLISLCR